MRRSTKLAMSLGLGLTLLATSCGGGAGRTAIVGMGNGGNRIFEAGGIAEALAEEMAENAATPQLTDELLLEIFDSVVAHARNGDPEAALIVYRVAAAQRKADEG